MKYCDFAFPGEGSEILSEKSHDMGKLEVFLDGISQGEFYSAKIQCHAFIKSPSSAEWI
jgi:hypothetical protein